MKRVLSGIVFLLLVTGLGAVAPVKIVGPTQVDAYKLVELGPDQDTAGAGLIWDIDQESVADVKEFGNRLIFTGPPGVYKVKLRVVRSDPAGKLTIETQRTTVTIGKPGPTPGPGPGPGPDPTPVPVPIPLEGLRVLILFDKAEETKYPEAQLSILYGKVVRDYLDSHCAKGPTGEPERRIWSKDIVPAGDGAHWGEAMKRPRQALPWIIISNGKTGFEGPLPKSVPETLELLKKYGGE